MHSLVYKCIKNVYNMGIDHVQKRGWSSPESKKQHITKREHGYIHQIIPTFSASIYQFYTQQKIPLLPLKIPYLYTESTAPTIKRTKEN